MFSVQTMLEETQRKDRCIENFPRAFNWDYTPYKQCDFSEYVLNTCKSIRDVKSRMSTIRICKMIVLGDVAVGKTSLVNRFCHQAFDTTYKATIGVDFEVERFDILDIPFNVQIWDTAGQERFKCIAQSYYRSAHIILLVFDFTNLMTLSHCQNWLEEAIRVSNRQPYIFLVGTKKDLLANVVYTGVERHITKIASELNAEYWAVSARTGEGIQKLFQRMTALAFNEIIEKEKDTIRALDIGSDLTNLKNDEMRSSSLRHTCGGCN